MCVCGGGEAICGGLVLSALGPGARSLICCSPCAETYTLWPNTGCGGRAGLTFPTFPYRGRIETEGLAAMALGADRAPSMLLDDLLAAHYLCPPDSPRSAPPHPAPLRPLLLVAVRGCAHALFPMHSFARLVFFACGWCPTLTRCAPTPLCRRHGCGVLWYAQRRGYPSVAGRINALCSEPSLLVL